MLKAFLLISPFMWMIVEMLHLTIERSNTVLEFHVNNKKINWNHSYNIFYLLVLEVRDFCYFTFKILSSWNVYVWVATFNKWMIWAQPFYANNIVLRHLEYTIEKWYSFRSPNRTVQSFFVVTRYFQVKNSWILWSVKNADEKPLEPIFFLLQNTVLLNHL